MLQVGGGFKRDNNCKAKSKSCKTSLARGSMFFFCTNMIEVKSFKIYVFLPRIQDVLHETWRQSQEKHFLYFHLLGLGGQIVV